MRRASLPLIKIKGHFSAKKLTTKLCALPALDNVYPIKLNVILSIKQIIPELMKLYFMVLLQLISSEPS